MRYTCFLLIALLGGVAPAAAQNSNGTDRDTVRAPERPAQAENQPDLARAADLIFQRTNSFREEKGRRPLQRNEQLAQAAQYFADYMAQNDTYGHHADGQRPADRASQHDYEYCIVLENIAYQYSTAGFRTQELARRFHRGWEESPGHRRNLLDRDVTEIGIAIAQSEETGYIYAVQKFGRPESARIEFEVRNDSSQDVSYELGDDTYELPPRYSRTHFRCRPAELVLLVDEEEVDSVEPRSGDSYVIGERRGSIRISRE
jgi:uncharacterized protein YkwD